MLKGINVFYYILGVLYIPYVVMLCLFLKKSSAPESRIWCVRATLYAIGVQLVAIVAMLIIFNTSGLNYVGYIDVALIFGSIPGVGLMVHYHL